MWWRSLSKQKKMYIIIFTVLVGMLLWAFCSARFLTHGFSRHKLVGTEDKQSLTVEDIILTETQENQKFWEIYGETASYTSDHKIALLSNCVGNFYKNNNVTMSFQSSQGTYNEEKNEIILYKDTLIVIEDGTSLRADRLIWSGNDKDIVAEGHVQINRNNELVSSANKIIISPNYDKFKIIGDCKTQIYNLKELNK